MKLFKNKRQNINNIIFIIFSVFLLTGYKSFDYEFLKEQKQTKKVNNNQNNNPKAQKSFESLIKGCVKKEGLFDYYWDCTWDNKFGGSTSRFDYS